jgi:CHASE2 domain-containing sensor protein
MSKQQPMIPLWAAAAACWAVSVSYVLSLYVWRPHPGGRQHPTVIIRRIVSVSCVSAVAWLPAAFFDAQVGMLFLAYASTNGSTSFHAYSPLTLGADRASQLPAGLP